MRIPNKNYQNLDKGDVKKSKDKRIQSFMKCIKSILLK